MEIWNRLNFCSLERDSSAHRNSTFMFATLKCSWTSEFLQNHVVFECYSKCRLSARKDPIKMTISSCLLYMYWFICPTVFCRHHRRSLIARSCLLRSIWCQTWSLQRQGRIPPPPPNGPLLPSPKKAKRSQRKRKEIAKEAKQLYQCRSNTHIPFIICRIEY